jgi:MFS family permease
MELPLNAENSPDGGLSFWSNPTAWVREQKLSRGYWTFFASAFFFDTGFCIYVFLFNLYLLDLHFNERAIGWIGGAITLGSVLGTLPAGALSRKLGIRPLLITCFLLSTSLSALRVVLTSELAQIATAFLAGLAMSSWGVCFLPAIARLTTKKNRTAAFSLICSAGIISTALGGVVCGYLPHWLRMAGFNLSPAMVKRLILLASCGIALIGIIPALRLQFSGSAPEDAEEKSEGLSGGWFRGWKLDSFLLRYLPCMALWSAVLAAFNPFANVYLERNLHVPMLRIGLIFSVVQVLQFIMGLVAPLILRALGLTRGIVVLQTSAAVTLAVLALARSGSIAIGVYIIFSAAQWMSMPGLLNLLMNETPDHRRGTASAMMLFCNALMSSAATAAAGVLFTRFGYPPVLVGIALLALIVALLFGLVVAPRVRRATANPENLAC